MPDVSVIDAWFEPEVCRNCGAARTTPFCGQKAARRFVWRDLRDEVVGRVQSTGDKASKQASSMWLFSYDRI